MTTAASDPIGPAQRRAQKRFSIALLGIAGWTDAVGFLLFAQLYVSFMSGDATQVGMGLGEEKWAWAAKLLAAQIVFVAGAALGRHLRMASPKGGRRALLLINATLIALTAIIGHDVMGVPAFALVVLAMGMQNSIMHEAAGVPVGSMVTGALVRLGENIADALAGRRVPIAENAGQWAAFVTAALLGTVAYRYLGAHAFFIPAAATLLLVFPERYLPSPRPHAVGNLV